MHLGEMVQCKGNRIDFELIGCLLHAMTIVGPPGPTVLYVIWRHETL